MGINNYKIFLYNLVLYTFLTQIVFANNFESNHNKYNINSIPAELLVHSKAVIRQNIMNFEIEDDRNAIQKVKYAITIFGQEERKKGTLVLWYDQFRKINYLNGSIYDGAGIKIRELNDDDIEDYSAYDGFSLFSDNRIKVSELYHSEYPYTVEFEYELEYDGFLNWPAWFSQNDKTPVEINRFSVATPNESNLRYWCNQDSIKPIVENNNDRKKYTWEVKNLTEKSDEFTNNDIEDIVSIVKIAPTDFEIEGFKGRMDSWENFGKWFYNLAIGRDELPDSTIIYLRSFINTSDSIYEKVKKIYQYMQSRTRYVSVQLGIGGWQPFDANYVHEKLYGDCKALVNYMFSLLKSVNIVSYPVLIKNGSDRMPFIYDFPSNQFNHVILCVPTEKDTLWLECTSQTSPFGHIGWSNENRKALLISENGGLIVETPKSESHKNIYIRKNRAIIDPSGAVENFSLADIYGNQQNTIRYIFNYETYEDQNRWLLNKFSAPDVKLENLEIIEKTHDSAKVSMKFQVLLPNYASNSGKRLFFNPTLMERKSFKPIDEKSRISPIRYNFPYCDLDSTYFKLPKDYKIESIPDELNISTSFATFNSKFILLEKNQLLYVRKMEMKKYLIPADKVNEYNNFSKLVAKRDREKVVLVKQ